MGEDGPITTDTDMLQVAASFYKKKLFDFERKPDIHQGEAFWSEVDKINFEELEKPFTEDEIKSAIMGSHACGTLGTDGSYSTKTFGYYQV